MKKFGHNAIEGQQKRPDGSGLKWKQIGVNEIRDSRAPAFFFQLLTADHPSQDGKVVAEIERVTIADTDLSDSWSKTEIFGGLNGVDVEFVDPSANYGKWGIIGVHFTTPSGVVRLDYILKGTLGFTSQRQGTKIYIKQCPQLHIMRVKSLVTKIDPSYLKA